MAEEVKNALTEAQNFLSSTTSECDCTTSCCCSPDCECSCPECWTEGCGLDPVYSICASTLECITPSCEFFASLIWCFGSPLAFPFIFCFDSSPHTNETSGWTISMLQSPYVRPCTCCVSTLCLPCGQWYVRRRALRGDMSQYKLWQGYHDGPHCLARWCDGAPITIKAGTYGESDCPDLFLCAEVWCLGGLCSPCCAFNVSRRLMKEERSLSEDPTEARVEKCAGFFGELARSAARTACCCCCFGCLLKICVPDSEGGQELSEEAQRASRACASIANTCYRGIWSVRIMAIGCMSAQMIHEAREEVGGGGEVEAPVTEKMERGNERGVQGVVLK